MINGNFTIRIEMLENGYTVEVPDIDKINELEKKAKSKSDVSTPYYGDCTEKKVAKSTGEVMSIVKDALANLPDTEFETAFNEASKKETE
jgi:hypothetical protein